MSAAPAAGPGRGTRWRDYIRLLRANPRFRRFWLAAVISQGGDWFNYIGIFVLLNRLTGSGGAVGLFLIAKFIPTTLFGPLAGVVADRVDRKALLVGCDALRVFIVLGLLLVREPGDVWLVYVLAFAQETAWTFAHPARQALIPLLCTPDDLNAANGLMGGTWSLMLAMGAAAGGFVTAALGWRAALVIDSASFVAAALLIAGLSLPRREAGRKRPDAGRLRAGFADLVEGFGYLGRNPRVRALVLVKSGWALSGGILVILTVFGEQVLAPDGRGGYSGVLYSMRGLGAAVGPLLAWRVFGSSRAGMARAIRAAFFVSSLAYLGFSLAPNLALAAPCVFCGHVGGATQWIFSTSLLHRTADPRFHGRVFAAEMALVTLVLSISSWCTGLALDLGADPRLVARVLALLFLVPGCLLLAFGQPRGFSNRDH